MKILMVAPQPFFSPRGTPFSVYYRTQVMCELGHEVDLLTYGQGKDVDIPGCRIIRIPGFSWFGSVRIGPSMFKLFLDCFMVVWTIGLLFRRRYDVVHAHEEAVFWCRWLKPVFRFGLIHDMHSSLPQQLDNFQYTRLRFIHWLFERLERSAARAAEVVIVVCPALEDYARTLTPEHDKIRLIENSLYDPVRVLGEHPGRQSPDPAKDTDGVAAAERWLAGRQAGQVVAYAGTLEAYQGIDTLIRAFADTAAKLPDASLLIVGGMPREVAPLRELVNTLGLGESVHLTGQVPQAAAQRLVARAAASVSPRLTGNNTPLKLYQLMGSGIPLVATRIESHTQVLNDDIAILTGVTTDELSAGMVRALSDREEAHAMARRAQEWYRQHYARDVYTAKMRDVLARVG
jgi:glycosyltransferase involved in cell wall biosynthesis